jgi:hypothetical protein
LRADITGIEYVCGNGADCIELKANSKNNPHPPIDEFNKICTPKKTGPTHTPPHQKLIIFFLDTPQKKCKGS